MIDVHEIQEAPSQSICPNDGTDLVLSTDPHLVGCLTCPVCDFVLFRSKFYSGDPNA